MRCYNGSPDKELQAILDAKKTDEEEAEKLLDQIGAHATYFPMENKWMVFDKNHHPLTEFHSSKLEAAKAALIVDDCPDK